MFIHKTFLSRRTMLRGIGTTIALPWLDSMAPALTALNRTAGAPKARLGVVYVPNGFYMPMFTPAADGTAFEFPRILSPLTPVQRHVTVVSGLDQRPAMAITEGSGDHVRASSTFLTGVRPKHTEGPDLRAGISLDQLVAAEIGKESRLASLELCLESNEMAGSCEAGYSCAYANTLCWRGPTTPMPMENDPGSVFERIFGDGTAATPEARQRLRAQQKSVLDEVADDVNRLSRQLGPVDRSKLTQYLDAVREVEVRIGKASVPEPPSAMQRPVGIPGTYSEHARLMFDLQFLAYQTDTTRVGTFMMASETSQRPYPEIGISEGHHGLSHHGGVAERLDQVAKINQLHVLLFSEFVQKLAAAQDGDATLLDHTLLLYGCGISDSNSHLHTNLPILVAGGGAWLKTGRHLRQPAGTPLTNLQLSLLDKLGVRLERFGDSTGRITTLSEL